ncbi:MAG: DUF21 domain-containing protein [Actinobacteria bacterium]|nr:DUF21 domain-containing protein [Actinomycetota bacterium]
MTSGVIVAFGIVAFLVVLTAVLAAAETALTRISRARAESLVVSDDPASIALVDLLEDRQASLAPLLLLRLGCQVASVAVVMVAVLDDYGSGVAAAAAVGIGLVLYVLAEAAPRTWALHHPDLAARRAVRPLLGLLRVAPLRWLTWFLNGIGNAVSPGPARAPVVSEVELIALTEAAAAGAAIESEERDLIESVFALGDTIIREVMVPRTDMVTVDAVKGVSEILDLVADKGFSRLPVIGDGIDDIVGILMVKDLLGKRPGGEELIGRLMRPAWFVPETKHADELLREMQVGRPHLAVVVDEYGGTAGLVTLEDLVEELVGEIVDEFDKEEPLFEPTDGGGLIVHGRMPVDQLESLIDAELDDGDWDTVGGLIFNTLGHVPEIGESVDNGQIRFGVERMEGRRITRVRLSRLTDD